MLLCDFRGGEEEAIEYADFGRKEFELFKSIRRDAAALAKMKQRPSNRQTQRGLALARLFLALAWFGAFTRWAGSAPKQAGPGPWSGYPTWKQSAPGLVPALFLRPIAQR
jgi:hypothetical protein